LVYHRKKTTKKPECRDKREKKRSKGGNGKGTRWGAG